MPDGQLPLLDRPQLIALNKVDVPEGRELADFVRPDLEARGYQVFEISAVSRAGLRELSFALADLVTTDRAAKAAAAEDRPRIVMRPRAVNAKDFEIRVEGGTTTLYRILGAKPERWVAQTDFDNEEAVGYLADRLAKLGVEEELFRVGATPGATVKIGRGAREVTFDWEPTLTSAAELIASPRGTDARLDKGPGRRTTKQRQEEYHAWMDAKAAARAELDAERESGVWNDDE